MWHFCRKSSDRTAEKSQEQTLQSGCEDGHFVGRVRQDFREVTRTDCSLIAKMALLSEEFRQDGREITRTECSHIAAV